MKVIQVGLEVIYCDIDGSEVRIPVKSESEGFSIAGALNTSAAELGARVYEIFRNVAIKEGEYSHRFSREIQPSFI